MAEYSRKQRNQLSRAIANNGGGCKQLKGIVDNKFNNISTSTFCGNVVQKKNEFGVEKTKTKPAFIVDEDQGCSKANKRGITIHQDGVPDSNRVYHASRTDRGNIVNDNIHHGKKRILFYKGLTAVCIANWDTVAVNKTFIWGDYTVERLLPYR